jgi:altronate dehydratase
VNSVVVIGESDNVATALEILEPGRRLELGGRDVTVVERIPSGHKIAILDIPAGTPVVKYGNPIGTATADIPAGAHAHTHNVASARGRGDLAARSGAPAERLAEPDEDALTVRPES